MAAGGKRGGGRPSAGLSAIQPGHTRSKGKAASQHPLDLY